MCYYPKSKLKIGIVLLHVVQTPHFCCQAIATEAEEGSPRSSSVDIIVNILDRNDNGPEFPPAGYNVVIPEGEGRRDVVRVGTGSELRGGGGGTFQKSYAHL